jgi:predicted nucleotidyltransferase
MAADIIKQKEPIAELCRSLGVESLLAFGSAASPSSLGTDSLVFLVQFKPMPSARHTASYFSLASGLEALLRTPVELTELEAGDNPYFKKAMVESRVRVHELSRS